MASKQSQQEVMDSFTCSICKDIFRKPVKLSCGHSFCQPCIDKNWEVNDTEQKCPVCRTLTDGCKTDDLAMLRAMSLKYIRCQKCEKKVHFVAYRKHKRICQDNLTLSSAALNSERHVIVDSLQEIHGNIYTFTCPHCDTENLSREGLLKHVNQTHQEEKTKVVCPICKVMPWGNEEQSSQNFVHHINIRHKFDYDRYVDLNLDDDTALQTAINLSMKQY